MVCDRASDAVILTILAEIYPSWSWFFLGGMVLDVVSHWYHMYVAVLNKAHHKDIESKWALLNLYYSSDSFMDTLIIGN